jgi:hypothetical protein
MPGCPARLISVASRRLPEHGQLQPGPPAHGAVLADVVIQRAVAEHPRGVVHRQPATGRGGFVNGPLGEPLGDER